MRNASPMRPGQPPEPRRRTGAVKSRHSWRDGIDSWLAHHRESSRDALRRLWQRPLATALTLLTLAIALVLPAGLSILVQNIHQITGGWGGRAHLSVFLDKSLSSEQQQRLAQEWRLHDGIDGIELITADEALAQYRQQAGSSDILAALPGNPLPAVLVIYPAAQQAAELGALKRRLQGERGVDKVVLDVAWIRKLQAFIELAQRLISALTLALAAGIILLVNNTLQLAIDSRRDEIVVMKTVGGTDGFVRRPFLYTGFWYGVGGGLLALILLAIGFGFIGQPAAQLLQLYGSQQGLTGLPLGTLLMLPLLAGLLGLLGAYIAVSRHIHDLDPRQF